MATPGPAPAIGSPREVARKDERHIHPGLAWLDGTEEGRAWLQALPSLLDGCVEGWSLRVGEPFPDAFESLVVPAELDDGTPAVLKVQFPGRENRHEADALASWDGRGAVRLLAHDPDRHAMLLERCEPGTSLSELEEDDALEVVIGLLPLLWRPAGDPFTTLADEAAWWAGYLPEAWARAGQPFERALLDEALDVLTTFPGSQRETVLLSQDLHAGNVLRAQRAPWLVVDPKPLLGEREFGIAAIVRGDELGRGPSHVRHRLDRLTSDLGLDRERARGWALAQTLAWAVDADEFDPLHVEVTRWLRDA